MFANDAQTRIVIEGIDEGVVKYGKRWFGFEFAAAAAASTCHKVILVVMEETVTTLTSIHINLRFRMSIMQIDLIP